ncbi:MAG: putative transport protein [uncultured Paraburkholderia sp.]|nr:MAG: putative transport protein [uncultured Paraburkholderia sp.]
MGAGLVLGLLIGLIVVDVGGIPLTLGSGGGCLPACCSAGCAASIRCMASCPRRRRSC